MSVKRPYYDEWIKSPWSTAENYMPYPEYAAYRERKDVKTELKKAKTAAADARKTLKRARRAVGDSE